MALLAGDYWKGLYRGSGTRLASVAAQLASGLWLWLQGWVMGLVLVRYSFQPHLSSHH